LKFEYHFTWIIYICDLVMRWVSQILRHKNSDDNRNRDLVKSRKYKPNLKVFQEF